MLRFQRSTRKHDFKASAIAYAELVFAIVCFLMVGEVLIFMVKFLSVTLLGQGAG